MKLNSARILLILTSLFSPSLLFPMVQPNTEVADKNKMGETAVTNVVQFCKKHGVKIATGMGVIGTLAIIFCTNNRIKHAVSDYWTATRKAFHRWQPEDNRTLMNVKNDLIEAGVSPEVVEHMISHMSPHVRDRLKSKGNWHFTYQFSIRPWLQETYPLLENILDARLFQKRYEKNDVGGGLYEDEINHLSNRMTRAWWNARHNGQEYFASSDWLDRPIVKQLVAQANTAYGVKNS